MVDDFYNHKCAECADFYLRDTKEGDCDGGCAEMCMPCNSQACACSRFRFAFVENSSCSHEEKKGNKDE